MNLYPAVILAGGLGTRLHPITEAMPKALVPVGGQPFIVQQLRLLRSRGFRQVVISVWYKEQMIRDAVGDGRRFDLTVQFISDGATPLGTGGAVRHALEVLGGSCFVLYGDSYLPCNYREIQACFDRSGRCGLMAVFRNEGRWDSSNVEMQDGEIVRYGKQDASPAMKYIDYGLGVFRPAALAGLRDGEPADLEQVYQRLLAEGQLLAYEVTQRFYEIGSPQGLQELDQLLRAEPDGFLHTEPT